MRLPVPPLPAALQPKPRRPGGEERVTPLDQAKEAGIHTVDWVDERTSLSGGLRWSPSSVSTTSPLARRAPELLKPAPGRQERLLEQVFGVLHRAEDPVTTPSEHEVIGESLPAR